MDFDPRDSDSPERDRHDHGHVVEPSRGRRGSSDTADRDDDWTLPGTQVRDHGQSRDLGRGPGSNNRQDDSGVSRRDRDDTRWLDREQDSRRLDPRDVFMRDLNLPRGPEREFVYDARERAYSLRESESRTLSTVGAFRVVSARDLRDHHGGPADPRSATWLAPP